MLFRSQAYRYYPEDHHGGVSRSFTDFAYDGLNAVTETPGIGPVSANLVGQLLRIVMTNTYNKGWSTLILANPDDEIKLNEYAVHITDCAKAVRTYLQLDLPDALDLPLALQIQIAGMIVQLGLNSRKHLEVAEVIFPTRFISDIKVARLTTTYFD